MHFIDDKEIRNLITVKDIIDAIEDYYLTDGETRSLVPERLFINDNDNSALLMPSFYENYYGAKLIGIAPGNVTINQPTLRGIFLLNERATQKPLVIMDARTISAMRTGAISGVAMKYLASEETDTVGVIGTGDQGWSHLQAACAVRTVKKVLVYNRSKERLDSFMEIAIEAFPNIQFEKANPATILKEAQIIITTTTSTDPVIPYDEQIDLTGKHFAGSGAFKSFMQEIPNEIIEKADHLFVDTHAAFSECGEMIYAKKLGRDEKSVLNLKTLVENGENDVLKEQVTVFKSVGMSIFDIITAKLIYEKYQDQVEAKNL